MTTKCELCNRESDYNYNGKELCKYHYWIERGRPTNESWKYIWKEYRNLCPVKVSRWRKKDPEFDKLIFNPS